jgi:hypothetical protein
MANYVWVKQSDGTERAALKVQFGLRKRTFLVIDRLITIPDPEYCTPGLELKFHPTEEGLWIVKSKYFDVYGNLRDGVGVDHPIEVAYSLLRSYRFDLGLMSWGDGTGVPTSGYNLVIVGTDNDNRLHIRIFDHDGDLITDTDETKLPRAQAEAISALKQKLPGLLCRQNLNMYNLRLMSALEGEKDIPTAGKSLIVVAAVKDVLYFRIFDGDGKRVVDTDETKLTTQAGAIEDLRKQLEDWWPPHEPTYHGEKAQVRPVITSIVGHPKLTVAERRQVLGEAGSIVGRNLFPCKIPPTIDPEHVAIARDSKLYRAWRASPERRAWRANLSAASPPRQSSEQVGSTKCPPGGDQGTPPAAEVEYDKLADHIGSFYGKLIRFMKDKTGVTHQEILDAVYEGSEREWPTIKTLVNRTNNKIVESMRVLKIGGPRLHFKADQRAYRVTKHVSGSSSPETPVKPG